MATSAISVSRSGTATPRSTRCSKARARSSGSSSRGRSRRTNGGGGGDLRRPAAKRCEAGEAPESDRQRGAGALRDSRLQRDVGRRDRGRGQGVEVGLLRVLHVEGGLLPSPAGAGGRRADT